MNDKAERDDDKPDVLSELPELEPFPLLPFPLFPPLPSPFEAELAEIIRGLQEIFRTPDGPGVDPIASLQGRYALALMMVCNGLRRAGAGDDVASKFGALGRWFFDVQSGRVPAVFKPSGPRAGWDGAPRSIMTWFVRALAVVAVECFKRSGMNLTAAYARVAQEKDLELALDRGATLVKSLKSWRDTIRAAKSGQGASVAGAGVAYRLGMSDVDDYLARLAEHTGRKPASTDIEALGVSALKNAAAQARELTIENYTAE